MCLFPFLLSVLMTCSGSFAQNSSIPLNVTVIATKNGASTLECWQLKSTPVEFASAVNFPLGQVTNATFSIIPPRTYVGLRQAPNVQITAALSGLIHITVNSSSTANSSNPTPVEAWIPGGRYGLLLAADTAEFSAHGHYAEFPGDSPTVLLQSPFAGNKIPEHDVLYERPCEYPELIGL